MFCRQLPAFADPAERRVRRRSWAEYKVGFGYPSGNYWIGNELIHQLTANNRYKLKFDLQQRNNPFNWYYAEYSTFIVHPESTNYTLQVAGYSGNQCSSIHHHHHVFITAYDKMHMPHMK